MAFVITEAIRHNEGIIIRAFGSELLTGALVDRLTHNCHILEANGQNYRLRQAKKHSKRHKSKSQTEIKK